MYASVATPYPLLHDHPWLWFTRHCGCPDSYPKLSQREPKNPGQGVSSPSSSPTAASSCSTTANTAAATTGHGGSGSNATADCSSFGRVNRHQTSFDHRHKAVDHSNSAGQEVIQPFNDYMWLWLTHPCSRLDSHPEQSQQEAKNPDQHFTRDVYPPVCPDLSS